MKRFLKNNILLVVILTTALLVSCVLLVLAAGAHVSMTGYMAQTEKMRETIEELINKTPAPVEDNLKHISSDAKFYKQQYEEIKKRFDRPLVEAQEAFAAVIDEAAARQREAEAKNAVAKAQAEAQTKAKAEAGNAPAAVDKEKLPVASAAEVPALPVASSAASQDDQEKAASVEPPKVLETGWGAFQERFKTFWEENKTDTRDQRYSRFRRMMGDSWKSALEKFQEKAQKHLLEEITENNVDEIFLSVLGVPRNMDGKLDRCASYSLGMRDKLAKLLADNGVTLGGEAREFSFTASPASKPEDIPLVLKNWEIIGDMMRRIAHSGIGIIRGFSKRSEDGTVSGDFKVYHYKMEVVGELTNIRRLVKLLNDAVVDNRVYVVRAIDLYKVSDGAGKILEPPQIKSESKVQESRVIASEGAASDPEGKTEVKKAPPVRDESKLPYHMRSTYGVPLIGEDSLCRAVLDIEYVSLISEPLTQ